ncbi:MAG: pitrilysin family protein [Myxococcota bacterium]
MNTSALSSLAQKPTLEAPKPFRAPPPQIFRVPGGGEVWLVEDHDLPVVAISMGFPVGSADDPLDRPGLASITAGMLDEGAGDLDALQLSDAINELGATLWAGTGTDGTRVALSVLKKHLPRAFGIFADVVARPRFDEDEWQRVTALWRGRLEKRADDPRAVAAITRQAVLYGADTPYGHPVAGQLDGAAKITRDDALAFYRAHYRPDTARMVVAGAITREEVVALWREHFGTWAPPASTPAPKRIAPPTPLSVRPRLVVVDRPGSQSVLSIVNAGAKADSPEMPLLELVNTALGGSFTSRLNQNLREDHGWTYGARSRFSETRGVGGFYASAAVSTDVTAAALNEMLGELRKMADDGLEPAELTKVRAGDLTDMIQTNERIDSVVGRLMTLALLELPPERDARASEARQRATLEQLNALARRFIDPTDATVVVVGPATAVRPQLAALGLGEPTLWGADARPAAANGKPTSD